MHWYYSNIKLNAIKLVLFKLIKMTTNTEYVEPVLKNLNSTSKQKPTSVLHLTKRHMISIDWLRLEKTYYASFFICFVYCFRNDCSVNIHFRLDAWQQFKAFYWIIGSRVYKPFGIKNGCRVNSGFILYARQPCI